MTRRNQLDSLEPRQLFTFAAGDATFGSGGLLAAPTANPNSAYPNTPELTAIADGRVLARIGGTLEFLTPQGKLDTKRGRNGTYDVKAGLIDVDAATGSFARLTNGDTAPSDHVQVFDGKGKRRVNVVIPQSNGVDISFQKSISILPDGSILIVSTLPHGAVDGTASFTARVTRLTSSGVLDTSFGTGGRAVVVLAAGLDGNKSAFTYDATSVDSTGRAYLTSSLKDARPDGSVHYLLRTMRLTAAGVLDAAYGDGGTVTLDDTVSKITGATRSVSVLNTTATADGTNYILTRTDSTGGTGVPSFATLTLWRVDAEGNVSSAVVSRPQVGGYPAWEASVAVGPDGDVYVATRFSGAAAQVFRYSANADSSLSPVDSWSDFGDGRQTTINVAPSALTFDAKNGRLVMAGNVTNATQHSFTGVYVVRGTDVFADVPSGGIRHHADGTLLIRGKKTADRIDVTRSGRSIFVLVNGGKSLRFADVDVSGLVIDSGSGDDRISLGDIGVSTFADCGGGNDTVAGAQRTIRYFYSYDTLVGGDGNDSLTPHLALGGAHLYGQAGKDTLWGTNYSDELFGGDGNDVLHGSAANSDLRHNDNFTDLLNGGSGADVIYAGQTVAKKGGQDSLVSDASDTVISV